MNDEIVDDMSNEMIGAIVDRDDALRALEVAIARAEAAEEELARLREGEGWRPVTDEEPAPLEYVVINTMRGVDIARRAPENTDLWHALHGQRYYIDYEIHGWLKLPPSLKPDEEE